jgi:hypothetical protein
VETSSEVRLQGGADQKIDEAASGHERNPSDDPDEPSSRFAALIIVKLLYTMVRSFQLIIFRNISSSSKIQRPPENPLQLETIMTLKNAQKTVEAANLLQKYGEKAEGIASAQADAGPQSNSYQDQHVDNTEPQTMFTSQFDQATSRSIEPNAQTSFNTFIITQSFALLPTQHQMASSSIADQERSPTTARNSDIRPKSIKSSSSTESFKSAISLQEADLEAACQIKAVQTLMHAFRTALQILENLIERRILCKDGDVYIAARDLYSSLHDRSKEIHSKHITNFRQLGQSYIEKFKTTNSKFSPQDISNSKMSISLGQFRRNQLDDHARSSDEAASILR